MKMKNGVSVMSCSLDDSGSDGALRQSIRRGASPSRNGKRPMTRFCAVIESHGKFVSFTSSRENR